MATEHDEIESPRDRDSRAFPHDSMVTVRLSEPPNLTVDTQIGELEDGRQSIRRRQTMPEVLAEDDTQQEQDESPRITMMDPNGNEVVSPSGSESAVSENGESRRGSESSEASESGINWEELEKTEEQEPRDESSDDVSARSKVC